MNNDVSFAVNEIINQLQLLLDNKKSEIDKLSISSDDKKVLRLRLMQFLTLQLNLLRLKQLKKLKKLI